MKRYALPLLFLVSCASAEGAGERVDVAPSSFTSVHAALLDFELYGELESGTADPATLRTQIEAQLLFTTGQLNGESSGGRLGQLEISAIDATLIPPPPTPPPPVFAPAPAPRYAVTYHAKLPVAWGGATEPATYAFTLPARMSEADQLAFTTKYGATCVDPSGPPVEAGTMFLFYRPQRPGCALAAEDVKSFAATVTRSAENTTGKSPEYHRVWKDGALEIVAIFTHEYATPTSGDEGVSAYEDFVWSVHQYLGELQPDRARRSEVASKLTSSVAGAAKARLAAELPDGRTFAVNAMLVGHALTDDLATFEAWYDALTPKADVVLYNGHAGHGANVKTLMETGSFVSGQYLIWFVNGCDTFAYVDRTLVDRRAVLNPDDPGGTKYMDTVTNVMAVFFSALVPSSLDLVHALVDARDASRPPKTYAQIFSSSDPTQLVVISGEEDNVLEPLPPAPPPSGAGTAPGGAQVSGASSAGGGDATGGTSSWPPGGASDQGGDDGCSVGHGTRGARSWIGGLALGLVTLALRRRRRASRMVDRGQGRSIAHSSPRPDQAQTRSNHRWRGYHAAPGVSAGRSAPPPVDRGADDRERPAQ